MGLSGLGPLGPPTLRPLCWLPRCWMCLVPRSRGEALPSFARRDRLASRANPILREPSGS
eukprot:7218938-Alexandrium_andersonii.AAC.1